eukprot:scaffold3243_cov47-Attheya_sp.AAC.1
MDSIQSTDSLEQTYNGSSYLSFFATRLLVPVSETSLPCSLTMSSRIPGSDQRSRCHRPVCCVSRLGGGADYPRMSFRFLPIFLNTTETISI